MPRVSGGYHACQEKSRNRQILGRIAAAAQSAEDYSRCLIVLQEKIK